MNSKAIIYLILGLIAIEVVTTLIAKWTSSHGRDDLQRRLGGRPLESLSEAEQESILEAVHADYNQTPYRKIDIAIFAYHMPALASWGIFTGRSAVSLFYYYPVTITFWFVIGLGILKGIAKLRGM